MSLLLAAGADMRVSNDYGNTPLQMARSTEVKDSLTCISIGGPDARSRLQQELKLQQERDSAYTAKVLQDTQQE